MKRKIMSLFAIGNEIMDLLQDISYIYKYFSSFASYQNKKKTLGFNLQIVTCALFGNP